MKLAHPEFLALLAILPVLALLDRKAWTSRAASWHATGRDGEPPRLFAGWRLLMLALLLLALARPLGTPRSLTSLEPGQDVVFLVDVSLSMAATDAAPNRLGLALEAAQKLLNALAMSDDSRAGVVAFAGRGVARCPLTSNLGAVAAVLKSLQPASVLPGGTDIGAGLQAALQLHQVASRPNTRRQSIILLSDGEHLTGDWSPVLKAAAIDHVTVHTIAVGDSTTTHTIPRPDGTVVLYQGQPVQTQRVDDQLQQLASATKGAFFPLGVGDPTGLDTLYLSRVEPVDKKRQQDRFLDQNQLDRPELYAWFTVSALASGVLGCVLAAFSRKARLSAVSAILLVCLASAGAGRPDPASQKPNRRELIALSLGQDQQALAHLLARTETNPADAIARFNAAFILHKLGRFSEAQAQLQEAATHAHADLKARIELALGNNSLAQGQIQQAIFHYRISESFPGTDPASIQVSEDAATNRAYAESLLQADLSDQAATGAEPPSGKDDQSTQDTPASDPPTSNEPTEEPRKEEAPEPITAAAVPDTQPQSSPRSAQERLDQAIDRVREANKNRLKQPASYPTSTDWKHW